MTSQIVTVALICLVGMSGCIDPAMIEAQRNRADDRRCQSYGARFGTPAYVQCRVGQDRARAQRESVPINNVVVDYSPYMTSFPSPFMGRYPRRRMMRSGYYMFEPDPFDGGEYPPPPLYPPRYW